ncbi:alpha/beta fold hydrolase [Phycicoccus sp. BSK3Z-2]|uniref:Alpha/beta fold hydrolase n=1 Tax=Phycicoccus avicenniae TaxID=2828860 RepID=A0A941D530_9MICO|nr:alpha/beta fold hydrolase [Phycicoccus avicenniae]MBR7741688.1 alpha/beta fold hydrolase [Phycicoccus avicenniae]
MTALHRTDTGPAGSGEPVLLSNPLGAPLEVWDALADDLAADHRVLRYDPPGHGRSPLREGVDVDTLADAALEVLDAAGVERAHVVGLSLGGMVGIALAAAHPERVASLGVLCSSAYFADKATWASRVEQARADGLEPLADGSLARWFTPEWASAHPDGMAEARRQFLSTDPEGFARSAEAVGALDLRDRLADVVAPTLVVAGSQDPSTPPWMGREIAEGVLGARYEELDGAHWLPVERPADVARLLREGFARA